MKQGNKILPSLNQPASSPDLNTHTHTTAVSGCVFGLGLGSVLKKRRKIGVGWGCLILHFVHVVGGRQPTFSVGDTLDWATTAK